MQVLQFANKLKKDIFKSLVSTIPPLGQYFNELIFVVLGGLEPCNHLQTFTVSVLPVELQDFLLFGGYCKPSLLNHSGLPWTAIVDFKTQDISHYIPLNPCKIYFILSMCWIMMTVFVLSPVSTSYLVLDSK